MSEKTKSTIFFSVITILIVAAIIITYCKFFIFENYQILVHVSCDPQKENCFVNECDPSSNPGQSCEGYPQYYKLISKEAKDIKDICPQDPNGNVSCPELTCNPGKGNCSYELCQDGNADGITCADEIKKP